MAREEEGIVRTARYALRRTWFTWGVVPLAVFALLALLAGSAFATSTENANQVHDPFTAILAVCCLVFLVAFSLDGHWTGAERIAKRLGGDPKDEAALRQIRGSDSGQQAARIMRDAAAALAIMGGVIAAGAIAALWAGSGLSKAVLLLLLAAIYHLFLLSRHRDYEQIIAAATSGDLLECIPKKHQHEDGAPRKRDANRQ